MRSARVDEIVLKPRVFEEPFELFFIDGRSARCVNHTYFFDEPAVPPIIQNFGNRPVPSDLEMAGQRWQSTISNSNCADAAVLEKPRRFSGAVVWSVPQYAVHLGVVDPLLKKIGTLFRVFIEKPGRDEAAPTQFPSSAHKKHSVFLSGQKTGQWHRDANDAMD
ncbi:MAG TPA: hypothetical protein VJU77_06915 [Chthoniobacterales bacterium]|nr:hypothetical protein [Chthoniobacterales bacterium]